MGALRPGSVSAQIARRFGLSELVIGLTVVAMGTSAPEVAVSVDAALADNGDVAVANVVGSNLFNVGLILGGIAVVAGVRSSRPMALRDGTVMVGSTLLGTKERLGRLEGAALVAVNLARWVLDLL